MRMRLRRLMIVVALLAVLLSATRVRLSGPVRGIWVQAFGRTAAICVGDVACPKALVFAYWPGSPYQFIPDAIIFGCDCRDCRAGRYGIHRQRGWKRYGLGWRVDDYEALQRKAR